MTFGSPRMGRPLIAAAASVVFAVLVIGLTARMPLRSLEGNLVFIESDEFAHRWPLAGVAVFCVALIAVAVKRRSLGWAAWVSGLTFSCSAAYLLWLYWLVFVAL
jgi:hypothetical protein